MKAIPVVHIVKRLDVTAGGTSTACLNLARAQQADGWPVTIVCEENATQNETTGITVVECGNINLLQRMTDGKKHNRIKAAISSKSIVHIHGVWDHILLIASKACRLLKKPYLVSPHGMLDAWCMRQKHLKKQLGWQLGTKHLLSKANLVHCLQKFEVQSIRKLGITTPVAIIPNGTDANTVHKNDKIESFNEAFPEIQNKPYLLFLGRLHYKKGLDYLARAYSLVAKHVPELQLVVAGPDEGGAEPCRAIIQQANLTDRVHFMGTVAGQRKWMLYQNATCFCLPSRQEGYSLSVLESLSCGVPVVISNECNTLEIETSGAGFCVELDDQIIAKKIQIILHDKQLAQQMSLAAKRFIADHHTMSTIQERFAEAYQSVITSIRAIESTT